MQELAGPECPDELVYVWEWFASFPRGEASKPSVTWGELEAFEAVAGVKLTAFEQGCLFDLDRAAMAIYGEKAKGAK